MKCKKCGGKIDNLPSDMPPFIQQHIRNQRKVIEQRKLTQRKLKSMANYNIPDHPPLDRRQTFGAMNTPSMSNVHYETVSLDGKTYTMWYENEAQRQQLMDEYRRRKFGVASEIAVDGFKENIFGMR